MKGWDIATVALVVGLMQVLVGLIIRPIALFALDQRYAAKKETEAIEGLFVRADDRWGEVESRVRELEITTRHEWDLISERMETTAGRLKETADQLSSISRDHIRLMTEWDLRNNPDGVRRAGGAA